MWVDNFCVIIGLKTLYMYLKRDKSHQKHFTSVADGGPWA